MSGGGGGWLGPPILIADIAVWSRVSPTADSARVPNRSHSVGEGRPGAENGLYACREACTIISGRKTGHRLPVACDDHAGCFAGGPQACFFACGGPAEQSKGVSEIVSEIRPVFSNAFLKSFSAFMKSEWVFDCLQLGARPAHF